MKGEIECVVRGNDALGDGPRVDPENCLWNADARATRYTRCGTIDRVIELPVANGG